MKWINTEERLPEPQTLCWIVDEFGDVYASDYRECEVVTYVNGRENRLVFTREVMDCLKPLHYKVLFWMPYYAPDAPSDQMYRIRFKW